MKQRIIAILIFSIIVYIISSIILVQLRNTLVRLDSKVTELEATRNILESETASIKAEIETLLSMTNLKKIAEEKKFVKPSKEQIIHLKK